MPGNLSRIYARFGCKYVTSSPNYRPQAAKFRSRSVRVLPLMWSKTNELRLSVVMRLRKGTTLRQSPTGPLARRPRVLGFHVLFCGAPVSFRRGAPFRVIPKFVRQDARAEWCHRVHGLGHSFAMLGPGATGPLRQGRLCPNL